MPQCLHGWGSDGINPSGCPQCDQLQRERDKEELTRLRERMRALLPLLEEGRRIASENYCGVTLLDSALRCGMRKGHDDRTHHKASVDMLGVVVIEASNVLRGYSVDSNPAAVEVVRERFGMASSPVFMSPVCLDPSCAHRGHRTCPHASHHFPPT